MTRRLHDLSEDSDNLKVLRFRRRLPTETPSPEGTFAVHFANDQVARRGYQFVDVPELRPLAAACDYLLVRTDGLEFKVIAIVDRDARETTRFTLPVAELQAIGEACLGYTGTVSGQKVPVSISVYEIGGEGDATEAIDRLAQYRGLRSRVRMDSWLMDTTAKRVWTNKPFAALGWKQSAERMLRSPRFIETGAQPTVVGIGDDGSIPRLTYTLIGLLVLIFGLEALRSGTGGQSWLAPSASALSAFGGLTRWAVLDQREWWRLITAPLLHTNPVHLIANCLSLGLMGLLLEKLIGWRWAIAGFVVGATTGALGSLVLIRASAVSVGASGGAVAWSVLALLIAFKRLPYGQERTLIMMWAFGALVPALVPLTGGFLAHTAIDYGAHIGGAVGGVATGFLILRLSRENSAPGHANVAAAFGIIWFALGATALAVGPLVQG